MISNNNILWDFDFHIMFSMNFKFQSFNVLATVYLFTPKEWLMILDNNLVAVVFYWIALLHLILYVLKAKFIACKCTLSECPCFSFIYLQ